MATAIWTGGRHLLVEMPDRFWKVWITTSLPVIVSRCRGKTRGSNVGGHLPRALSLKQAFGLYPVEAASGLTRQTQDELERYVRSSTCVAVGDIGLDYTRVRSANGQDLQRKVFGRLCRFANEVGKPVVIHCRGGRQWCLFRLSNHPDAESFTGPSGVLASLLWKCSCFP